MRKLAAFCAKHGVTLYPDACARIAVELYQRNGTSFSELTPCVSDLRRISVHPRTHDNDDRIFIVWSYTGVDEDLSAELNDAIWLAVRGEW